MGQDSKPSSIKTTCPPLMINTDGACSGNPGPASVGVFIRDLAGNEVTRIAEAIGPATSNEAEYRAIIRAIDEAITLGATKVKIVADSQLVVRQIEGRYVCNQPRLQELLAEVKQKSAGFAVFRVAWVPREQNDVANGLAQGALARRRGFADLSPKQQNACRAFSGKYGAALETVAQHLDRFFSYAHGEIDGRELEKQTGFCVFDSAQPTLYDSNIE